MHVFKTIFLDSKRMPGSVIYLTQRVTEYQQNQVMMKLQ